MRRLNFWRTRRLNFWRTRRIPSHDIVISAAGQPLRFERRVACSQLLVVERGASKSRGAIHKLNRHAAVEFLAHPARFPRTILSYRLRGNRYVSNGALLVLNYLLSNAARPNRGAQYIN